MKCKINGTVVGTSCDTTVITVCPIIDSYEDDPDVPGERRLCSSNIVPPLQISVTEEELRLLRCVFPYGMVFKMNGPCLHLRCSGKDRNDFLGEENAYIVICLAMSHAYVSVKVL